MLKFIYNVIKYIQKLEVIQYEKMYIIPLKRIFGTFENCFIEFSEAKKTNNDKPKRFVMTI